MLKEIFHYIYCMSIPSTIIILIVMCSLWSFLNSECDRVKKSKMWQSINKILFIVWTFCVLYMTVFIRDSIVKTNFIPFHFIIDAIKTGNEEFFRTGWMNILLFVPGGMWLTYGIKKQTKLKYVLQIVFLMIGSVSIEILQWYYQLGTVETDDVICNTLGATIGVTSVIWAEKLVIVIKPYIIKAINLIKQKIIKP